MEAVPIGDDQPEEQEENRQSVEIETSGTVDETVASTDYIDSEKMDVTDGNTVQEEATPSGGPTGTKTPSPRPLSTNQNSDEEHTAEQTVVLDSSPEKMPSEADKKTTHAASLKSPVSEIFSVDDEEEHEEEEEDDEELDEDEYDDEEDEIYVEEKEPAVLNDSTDEEEEDRPRSKMLDLSTDEYTDEEAEEERSKSGPTKSDVKPAVPTAKRKATSDLEDDVEDEDDDDDVQIVTDDEDDENDVEEDDDEDDLEDEEEVIEMSSSPEKSIGGEMVARKLSSGSSSSSSEARSPRLKVKYRTYRRKQAAILRKRSCRILNKRSMHGMEASGDALVVCSDTKIHNLTTNLKPFLALPQEHGQQQPLKVQKLPSTSVLPQELDSSDKSVYVTTTIGDASSTDGQSETKEPAGDKQDLAEAQATSDGAVLAAADTVEKSSDAITSTTPSTGSAAADNMPTATAVEVSEKIADSSDDAVSMLSSAASTKKTVTATTPTVNSSASTEPAEQKAAEHNASDTVKERAGNAGAEGVPIQENSSTISQEPTVDDKRTKRSSPSPNVVAIAEPTADDVMAGIDDFMDQNGSEDADEEEGKSAEKDFNEDLTFQMDVDEPVGASSSEHTKSPPPPVAQRAEVSAIDLSSVSELSKAQSRKSVSPGASNESTTTPVAVPPPATKESDVDMHDKTVVTSTPDPKKVPSKRTERGEEQEAGSTSLELVKCEREDAEDTGGEQQAENLSKPKTSGGVRDGGSQNLSRKASQPETVNRKRRRSVETEEERQAAAEQAEPVEPAKKLKLEVEANYNAHDRVVNEYIETTQNTSVDEIQTHTDALVKEIQTLNDMIRDTELQWNNLIHLKKVKEEILLRLNRRKHVIGITDTRLGEVSVYSHLDSSNLSSQHHHHQQTGRSSSVGPRPPTPPPEVEIRPASVTNNMHYGHGSSSHAGGSTATNGNSMISNRRSSSSSVQTSATTGKRSAKDTNSFVSQFNSSNNAVTMVPLSSTTSMILNARASMNTAEVAKEKATAVQIQRHILPKPVLSNHQQILNNLAMSAGLTGATGGSTTALLNGHHNPSGSNASQQQQQHQQQLQIGRQGMRKDVSSIIADYRQKHPENVPRRGRRLKNVGGGGGGSANNNGTSTFGEGGAISLTALSGGKSPGNARPNSTDSVANRISELLAAAETSRPSSNDSSQSSSNLLTSLVSASGAANSSQQFFKDVLAQFAKMSQNEQNLLSNLQLLSNNASTTNTVSSPQQSPQQQQQQHHHHQSGSGGLHQQQSSTLFSKTSLPEVTLHPVMNSTAHSDVLGGGGGGGTSAHGNGSLTGANLSAVNSSTNSLLHGILTKSASRPGSSAAAAAAAAAAAVGNINTFSPTLARLLTGPERMNNQASGASSSSSTVTSGALANLQTNSITGGLNLSKNINEISITPVVGSNFQQTLLAQQQQQQQLQRLREQHLFKGDSYLNLDDEADDSVDRLVIDEGDDMGQRGDSLHGSKRRGAEINENEVPQCQGCKKQEAKFVCAGCGNQWYCSRACQVNAWDDHSEVCSG